MQLIQGETELVIRVPSAALYAYLLDFQRHPEWASNLSKVTQVTRGPIGVGTVFHTQEGPPPGPLLTRVRMMRHFIGGLLQGAKPYSRAEITALEPRQRIAWRAGVPRGAGYFNLAEWEFLLHGEGETTRLVQRFCYKPQTQGAARMVATAGAEGITRACAINLARLKTAAEQKLAQPATAHSLADSAS
jgi:uncharacterized membrane protein